MLLQILLIFSKFLQMVAIDTKEVAENKYSSAILALMTGWAAFL